MDILPLVGVTRKSVSLAPGFGVTLARKKLEEGNVSRIALFGGDDIFPGGAREGGFERTMYLLSALTFDVWIASTIAYVILWLEGRRAR